MTSQEDQKNFVNEHPNISQVSITSCYDEIIRNRISESEEINILEGDADSFLPDVDENEEFIQPLHLNMRLVNDPPRISADPLLAGYNPFRSDFETEYDNKAESVLALLYYGYNDCEELENPEDELLIDELKTAIVEGYNLRLEERAKRKKIIREHGLISLRQLHSWYSRKEVEVGKENLKHIIRFMQFTSCTQFDKLLASMHNFYSLRNETNRLLNYRHQGLTRFESNNIYEKLLQLRQESLKAMCKKPVAYFSVPCQMRRPAPPLKIYHLPGYKQLNEAEVDLCSNHRIIPKDYLKFKQAMVTECEKNNGLKLAIARSLIKIDVNKTRKLFDFLMENGEIWKPKP